MSSDSELGIDTIDPAYHIVARQWANESAREENVDVGGDSRPAAEYYASGVSNGRGTGAVWAFIDAMESNVWIQPFDDHPAQQATRFDGGRTITDFAWSPDGSRLAVAHDIDDKLHRIFKGSRR